MYVPARYKSKRMCNKVIRENSGMLEFVIDCYKNENMCNKGVNNFAHALNFFSDQ